MTSFLNHSLRSTRQLLQSTAYRLIYYTDKMDLSSVESTFKAKDLEIHPSKNLKPLPQFTAKSIPFGLHSADHMLTIDWSREKGWQKPIISEMKPIPLHRFNSSLHYAIQCFQGFKAYKNDKDEIRLFRADCNMVRLKNTSRALCLPDFDGNQLLKCVEQLVRLDKRWIPAKRGFSLYLRPTHISMENTLGVKDASNSQLYVVSGPTGPYYPEGFKPVGLYCQTERIRSAPRGYGMYKMGSNYGPTLLASKKAQSKGYSQCLWLFEGQIVEVGASNIMFVINNKDGTKELLTPSLDQGMILPGVTRDSILKIVSKKKGYKVTQRKIMIDEIIEALEKGTISEIFGTGTAVIVSPVKAIGYKDKHYAVPYDQKLQSGPLAYELFNEMLNIQEGITQHPWSWKVT